MYNFWIQTWTYYKGLYDWLHPRGYIANVIGTPVMFVLMWAMMGRYAIDPAASAYYAIGMNVSTMGYNIISALTMSYANDRWYSGLTYLYITKANRFLNFLSRCIPHYTTGLLSFITGMVMIRLITPVDFGAVNWTGLIVATLVVAASVLALAQFLGIFCIIFTEWLNTLAFSLGVTFILCGFVLPLNIFPQWVQEIGKLLPMTNGLIAIRAAFSGAAFSTFWFDILREALTGIVYFVVGYYCFVFFERVVKRSGKLEMEQYG